MKVIAVVKAMLKVGGGVCDGSCEKDGCAGCEWKSVETMV